MDIRVTLVDVDGRSGPALLPDNVPLRRLLTAFETLAEDDLDIEVGFLGPSIYSPAIPSHSSVPPIDPNRLQRWLIGAVGAGLFLFFCGYIFVLSFMRTSEHDIEVTVIPATVAVQPTRPSDTAVANTLLNFELTQLDWFVEPDNLLVMDGVLFLTAVNEETNSVELWRTDGTIANTRQISHFDTLDDRKIALLTVVGDHFFFVRRNAELNRELWVSDGSLLGTKLLQSEIGASAIEFTGLNDVLFFSANDGEHGIELWRSDGTAIGTHMVKDIDPEGISYPLPVGEANGLYYFMADDGRYGRELWLTNGSAAGTIMVADLALGSRDSNVDSLVALEEDVYFVRNDVANGRQLWWLDWGK